MDHSKRLVSHMTGFDTQIIYHWWSHMPCSWITAKSLRLRWQFLTLRSCIIVMIVIAIVVMICFVTSNDLLRSITHIFLLSHLLCSVGKCMKKHRMMIDSLDRFWCAQIIGYWWRGEAVCWCVKSRPWCSGRLAMGGSFTVLDCKKCDSGHI